MHIDNVFFQNICLYLMLVRIRASNCPKQLKRLKKPIWGSEEQKEYDANQVPSEDIFLMFPQ